MPTIVFIHQHAGSPEYSFSRAHRADHLGAGVGDRTVALDRPRPPVGHGHLPIVQVPPDVPRRHADVGGDGLGGAFAPQSGCFNFDAEGLLLHALHGVPLSPGDVCPRKGYRISGDLSLETAPLLA